MNETNRNPTRREFLKRVSAGVAVPLAFDRAAAEIAANLPSPPAQPVVSSHGAAVGSLYPLIYREATKAPPALSFLHQHFRSPRSWKERARGKWFELMHYSPAKCDPAAEIVESVDRGAYVREKVYFFTSPGVKVPAYVLVPKNRSKPLPAIVALHDHGAFYLWGKEKLVSVEHEHKALAEWKANYYGGNSIADTLASQGYVVIVTDAFYWGERRMLLDDDPQDWRERSPSLPMDRIAAFNKRCGQAEDLVGKTILAAGFTWSGFSVWNDIRTLDYLITRPEVDKNRIGCVGLSMGGLRSGQLAAADDRIKAAVAVGWMASFPYQLKTKVAHTIGHTSLVPGLYGFLDYPDVVSLALPSALLVINGTKDQLFDLDGVKAAFEELRKCYIKAGAAEKFEGAMFKAPHEFNLEMQAKAWSWLKRWL
jgi:dienelactone hydrolase